MAKPQLNVAVVGAGLGGLAAAIGISRAGHLVTIFEQSPILSEIGAGIQLPPNSSRILQGWGLLPQIESFSIKPVHLNLRSYLDGKILGKRNLNPYMEGKYGAPYRLIHRADFHRVLVKEAERLGVKIRLGSEVQSINFHQTSLQIKDGGKFHADVILGADGLRSKCREELLGRPDPPQLTGDLAYRIVVKVEDMMQDPDLFELVSEPAINCWAGPKSHAVCYPLKAGGFYNMVLIVPGTLPELANIAKADRQEILDIFKDWDPKLRALISLVKESYKWPLSEVDLAEMKAWTHSCGTFALLGDACHAAPPHLGQGAAMAVEDGATLGLLFDKIQSYDQLKDILVIYESIRKPRASLVVQSSTKSRWQMTENPQECEHHLLEDFSPFSGPEFERKLFGYNANDEVDSAWRTYLQGHLPGVEARNQGAEKINGGG